jgi:hypothetical protein
MNQEKKKEVNKPQKVRKGPPIYIDYTLIMKALATHGNSTR